MNKRRVSGAHAKKGRKKKFSRQGLWTILGVVWLGGLVFAFLVIDDIDLVERLFGASLALLVIFAWVAAPIYLAKSISVLGPDLEEVFFFAQQMYFFTKRGFNTVEAMRLIADEMKRKRIKAAVADAADNVERGEKLSQALARHPRYFDERFIAAVQAGENSGRLAESFYLLKEWANSLRRHSNLLSGAVIYPLFVAAIAFLVVMFLLTKVVPTFGSVFASFGTALPPPTAFLIGLSNVCSQYWAIILLVPVLLFVLFLLIRRRAPLLWKKILWMVPVAKEIDSVYSLERFSAYLGLLVGSGVPLVEALGAAAPAAGPFYARQVKTVTGKVSAGRSLSAALRESGGFPELMEWYVQTGEESGDLATSLKELSEAYYEKYNSKAELVIQLVEPLLIVTLGIAIGFIIIAMFMPMFAMGDMVS